MSEALLCKLPMSALSGGPVVGGHDIRGFNKFFKSSKIKTFINEMSFLKTIPYLIAFYRKKLKEH